MDEWKSRDREAEAGSLDDDETLLPEHEFETDDTDGTDGTDDTDDEGKTHARRGVKSTFWMILAVTGTLAGRRVLTTGFPYPFYFLFLVQLGAYVAVAVITLLARLRNLRRPRPKSGDANYSWLEICILGTRTLASSAVSGVAVLFGVQALVHYPNLPVLAMLPILTYVSDSILFRIAYASRLLPRGQNFSFWGFYKVILVPLCTYLAIYEDYRLEIRPLLFALAGFGLASLSKLVSRIRPRIDPRGVQTWETPLQQYLLAGIPPLVLAGYAASKYENIALASHIARSWTLGDRLMNVGPPILLHLVFGSSIYSAYPFISQEHVGGALEEPSDGAREAITTTLQTGFWLLVVGVLGNERTLVDWYQVGSFTIVYLICVGWKHIGYYPPRLLNILLRIFRRRQLQIHTEPWQFKAVLSMTTLIFGILMGTYVMYWVDSIAYNRNLKTWLGPAEPFLDTQYRPPVLRSLDVVIAHSAGDPVESISELITTFVMEPWVHSFGPRVIIYTKDPTFNMTDTTPESLRGPFEGTVVIQTVRNIGGPTASFLHHILSAWTSLTVQTIFLSTSNTDHENIALSFNRMSKYYIPAGFPLPDALPKTGFLNFGPLETCWCGQCYDSLGWEDSFHLIPSMWGAVRPGSEKCESVLLTHGNNFLVSAARIRGVKKDVWELLYDALMNEDLGNAWAHRPEKMPRKMEGELNQGRWGTGGIYGEPDSLENPYLGFTIERLWGVLLQCSTGHVAWKCPTSWRNWRFGENREDCGCTEGI